MRTGLSFQEEIGCPPPPPVPSPRHTPHLRTHCPRDALVQHYATNGSTLPASQFSDRPCWSTPLINEGWRHAMRCHAMEMDFMGYPVKHRTAFHHEFWPQTRTPRGFTFFFSEPKTLWLWPREELYMPGDFVIHSHSNEVVTNLTKYHALRGTQCRGRLPKAG